MSVYYLVKVWAQYGNRIFAELGIYRWEESKKKDIFSCSSLKKQGICVVSIVQHYNLYNLYSMHETAST